MSAKGSAVVMQTGIKEVRALALLQSLVGGDMKLDEHGDQPGAN